MTLFLLALGAVLVLAMVNAVAVWFGVEVAVPEESTDEHAAVTAVSH